MIELRAAYEVDEEYIFELHEYRYNWVLAMNAMVNNELSEDELTNILLLTDYYCKLLPPLNKYNVNEDLGLAIKGVLVFLNETIEASEEIFGNLSQDTQTKVDFFSETILYVQKRMVAMNALEKTLG